MNDLPAALWIETRKAWRSKMPLLTALGFLMVPLAGAFFMLIYKDPELARQSGLISAKANLMAGTADWPTYLNLLAQATAVGGIMLFSLIISWVFGREFADGTVKDLLAVPLGRGAILAAKFLTAAVWSILLTGMIYLAGLGLGALVGLPPAPSQVFLHGAAVLAVTAGLLILTLTPVALFAGLGRGYLAPLGVALLLVMLANIAVFIGWGDFFPWSVPALYSGMASGRNPSLPGVSYWIVVLTGVAGVTGTFFWWKFADQSR